MLHRSPLKKYAPNFVHPVGGKVDLNENPYIAAIREVQEEAGITVKNLRLEAVFLEIAPVKDEPYNWQIYHFSADYDGGEVLTTEEGELVWLTKEEIMQSNLFPSVKEVITNILNPNDGTVFATFEYEFVGDIKKVKNKKVNICKV